MAQPKTEDAKAPRQSGALWITICIGVLVLVIVLALIYRGQPKQPTVSARELALDAVHFLNNRLKSGTDYYGFYRYDLEGVEKLTHPNHIGTTAWQTLAGLALMNLGEKGKGREHIDFYVDEWTKRLDGQDEVFATHQIFELFRELGDLKFLVYAWSRWNHLTRVADTGFLDDTPTTTNVMLTATLARALAQLTIILQHPEGLARLSELQQFTGGASEIEQRKRQFVQRAESLLELAAKYAPDENRPLFADDPVISQPACFLAWAKHELYSATKQQRYLDEVIDFLKTVNFHSRNPEHMYIGGLQSVLPCMHLLLELRTTEPSFLEDFDFIMEEIAIPGWDSRSVPLCDGDGGFFTRSKREDPERRVCSNNVKSVSDNAWMAFLLSKIPDRRFRVMHNEVTT